MSRIDNILLRARDTLSDPAGKRWDDDRLLRLIDEGQKEIVRSGKLLRAKIDIPISKDVAVYALPSDCYKAIRILYEGTVIPLTSHEELDTIEELRSFGAGWESATSDTVQKIVFDKLNTKQFKAYPIPSEDTSAIFTNAEQTPPVDKEPAHGIVVNISDYTMSSVYGVVVELSTEKLNLFTAEETTESSADGVLTYFNDQKKHFTVYYLKEPTGITATTDELEIDGEWDVALKYFVTGMALRDDKDTQSRQQGAEELQFFANNVKTALVDASNDFMAVRTQYTTPYITGFNI